MAKGGQFERDLCKELSLWWSSGASDEIFWRTAGSGARSTVRHKQGKSTKFHCGDIAAIDPIGQPLLDTITFELKRGYGNATIHAVIDKSKTAKKQEYEEWIDKAIKSKEASGSFSWVIIHKRDRRETMIFMPQELLWELDLVSDVRFMYLDNAIEGLTWNRWLREVSPDTVRRIKCQPEA